MITIQNVSVYAYAHHTKRVRSYKVQAVIFFCLSASVIYTWDMEKKILLVDDDAATRMTLGLILQQSGFQVIQADDGKQGYAKAMEDAPDLIITDFTMPEMTGTEMVEKLREQEQFAQLPVIMLTSDESIATLNSALQYKVRDYLNKNDTDPMKIVELAKSHLGVS